MTVCIDVAKLWRDPPPVRENPPDVELGAGKEELLWVALLHVASTEGAWCIRYDPARDPRLTLVTYRTEYALVPPPDEYLNAVVAGLERLTRPAGCLAAVVEWLSRRRSGRVNRAFDVLWKGGRLPWVASWPVSLSGGGAIVLFRTTGAGVRNDGPPGLDPELPSITSTPD